MLDKDRGMYTHTLKIQSEEIMQAEGLFWQFYFIVLTHLIFLECQWNIFRNMGEFEKRGGSQNQD